jgi:HK97 family phage prohead protease
MTLMTEYGLERKFCQLEANVELVGEAGIEGYASRFGEVDQGGDLVAAGAYSASLAQLTVCGRAVKMLWQHDPSQPIGIWDEVREDERGLYVKGRLLTEVARAREAATLLAAGAIDGLSIGYRTVRAHKNEDGRRVLAEIDLWEVSLVTFPMLPTARVSAKADTPPATDGTLWHELAEVVTDARRRLACTD